MNDEKWGRRMFVFGVWLTIIGQEIRIRRVEGLLVELAHVLAHGTEPHR